VFDCRQVFKTVTIGVLTLLCAPVSGADFSFQGFRVGMSREEASRVRPELPWSEEKVLEQFNLLETAKLFQATYLGKSAGVRIQLDTGNKFVSAIEFTFNSATSAQCAVDAGNTLDQLRTKYGNTASVVQLSPGKWVFWEAKEKLKVTFIDDCSSAHHHHYVIYAGRGG
jgi:hypothetical protein